MGRTLGKILKNSYTENDENLPSLIFNRINILEKRKLKTRAYSYASLGVISFVLIFPALSYTASQFSQSGFFEYFSIVFSDISLAFSFWEDLLMSLVSTLPMFGILLSFSFVFATLVFLKKVFLELKRPLLIA
jgi:hypothetical protein